MPTQWVKCKVVGDGANEPFRPNIARVNEAWERQHGRPKYPISYGIVYNSDKAPYDYCFLRIECDQPVLFDKEDIEQEITQPQHWEQLYREIPGFRARWQIQPDEHGEDIEINEWHRRIELNPDDTIPFEPKQMSMPIDPTFWETSTNNLNQTETTTSTSYNVNNANNVGNWNSNVYINYGTGATQIGTNVGAVNRSNAVANANGYLTNTWAAPATTMNTTDLLVVNVKLQVNANTKGQNFTGQALGAVALDASTWTFNYWTQLNHNAGSGTRIYFNYGNSSNANYQSQINNINYAVSPVPLEEGRRMQQLVPTVLAPEQVRVSR